MEVKNRPKTEKEKYDEWDALLNCFDENKLEEKRAIDIINERIKTEKECSKSYKKKMELQKEMEQIKKVAPQNALQLMMELQMAIDDNDIDKANELIFDVDNKRNLMDTITDLIFVSNHSEIIPPKKKYIKERIDKAQILANALDPKNKDFVCCPKCSRPMMASSLQSHQSNTLICREIKAGREKTLQLGTRKDERISKYIAKQTIVDDNDSDDE